MSEAMPSRLASFQWLSEELLNYWIATEDFSLVDTFTADLPQLERNGLLSFLFYDGLIRGDGKLAQTCMARCDLVTPMDPSAFGPLHYVIADAHDRPDIIAWLVSNGAEIERRGYGNATPLISAVGKGLYGTVAKLVEYGASVNATTEVDDNESSLMVAASNGDLKMIRLLVANGADAYLKNRWGADAAQIAESHGYHDVANALRKV